MQPNCFYESKTFEDHAQSNSAYYTEQEVMAIWSRVDWANIQPGDRVVSLTTTHGDGEIPCLNCYGYYFPCCAYCKELNYTVATYAYVKSRHVASAYLPASYEEYALMSVSDINNVIEMAWRDSEKKEFKKEFDKELNELTHQPTHDSSEQPPPPSQHQQQDDQQPHQPQDEQQPPQEQ